MSAINPMYEEGGEAMKSEIKRLIELEWPLKVSASVLPADLKGQAVGDIGAGPSPSLGKLVESRGGKCLALDRNFEMATLQHGNGQKAVQADVIHLPFRNEEFDILHTRFVIMNLPASQRADAIRELARCGKKNVILELDWTKFNSENPSIQTFIANARELAELAGTDLDFGGKLKQFVETTLPGTVVSEKPDNQGPIKDYKTLASLAKSMQGLVINLQNIEAQTAEKQNRPIDQNLFKRLSQLQAEMQKSESEFLETEAKVDKSGVPSFISPDIVAVTF